LVLFFKKEHSSFLTFESAPRLTTAPLAEAIRQAIALLPTPALAERQAAEILRAVPNHPEALLILGSAERRQGKTRQAYTTLERLARAQPRAAAVHAEFSLVLAELGHTEHAIAATRHALTLNPALPGIWRQMATLLTQADQQAAAQAAWGRHVEAAAQDPTLLRAADAMNSNRLPEAEHILRAHLAQHPTDVAALRMLAEIGTRFGRDADAEKILTQCLALMPGFSRARYNLAVVLFRQNNAADALPHLEILREADPKNPDYANLHGACLAMTGDYIRSIEVYDAVLADFPAQPKIWLSFAHALRTAGQRERSVSAYRTAITQAPEMGEAYWSLANFKNVPLSAAEEAAMRTQLAHAGLATEDRLHFHYALGYVLEQQGDYAASFQHYAAGAALRRGEITYSADKTTAQITRTRTLMTQGFFAEREGVGCHDEAPIFIVGLPRSGSTLIEQILASHSQVEGTMELPEMANIARDLGRNTRDDTYPAMLATLEAADFARLGERFLSRTRIYRKTAKPIFIDKMPNNFAHTGLIHLILPRAKIIDARRHPMAACFSAFKQHFAKGQHFTYDLTDLGRYYSDYLALMAHFDAVLPGRVHRVQYEEMVDNAEAVTKTLLAHCNLNFEESCLRFHENARPVRTASSEQVRRPIFREGLDHWRNYEPWLGELAEALGSAA
jgi:tetratricopeptide (TPR) repeat protein